MTLPTPPDAAHGPARVVVSATASSRGKTTVSVGLMAALAGRGLSVAPFKVGPDYIDPGYHTLATGHPGRNLDAHLCGPERIAPLFLHGSRGCDVAVVEGVMGLYDGRIDDQPGAAFGSTAHVAKLLRCPVVLVLDAAHSSRTLAAEALGMALFDPDVEVAGVVLNRTSSERNIAQCTRSLAEVGMPVLGALPRSDDLVTPSRHLGLVPAAERDQARTMVEHAARLVAGHVDLDALLQITRDAARLDATGWDPAAEVTPVAGRPRVAVAGGRAFTFRYPETVELLQAAGCEVVEFDPMTDPALPPGTDALHLGGGFPQMYATELAANTTLLAQVGAVVRAGLPTVAECAGLLYLCRTLDGGTMADAIARDAAMTPRLTLGYRSCVAPADTLLADAGQQVPSHEFHRTALLPPAGGATDPCAWLVDRPDGVTGEGISADPAGTGRPTLHASYQHLHWAGFPQAAQRLAEAAARWHEGSGRSQPRWAAT